MLTSKFLQKPSKRFILSSDCKCFDLRLRRNANISFGELLQNQFSKCCNSELEVFNTNPNARCIYLSSWGFILILLSLFLPVCLSVYRPPHLKTPVKNNTDMASTDGSDRITIARTNKFLFHKINAVYLVLLLLLFLFLFILLLLLL